MIDQICDAVAELSKDGRRLTERCDAVMIRSDADTQPYRSWHTEKGGGFGRHKTLSEAKKEESHNAIMLASKGKQWRKNKEGKWVEI